MLTRHVDRPRLRPCIACILVALLCTAVAGAMCASIDYVARMAVTDYGQSLGTINTCTLPVVDKE